MIIQLKEFINDPVFDRSFTGASDPEYTARANEAFENAHGLYDISASAAASREKNEQYSEALGQIISSYLPEIISGERPRRFRPDGGRMVCRRRSGSRGRNERHFREVSDTHSGGRVLPSACFEGGKGYVRLSWEKEWDNRKKAPSLHGLSADFQLFCRLR